MWSFTILCVTLLVLCGVHNSYQSDKLSVKVFYTVRSPSSKKFITDVLQPAMKGRNFIKYTNLELIPDQNLVIGPCDACEDHSVHACLMQNYDMGVALDAITCMLKGTNYYECSEKPNSFNMNTIKSCMMLTSSDELLEKYSKQNADAKITRYPTVQIDGDIISDWNSFPAEFCNKYSKKFNRVLDSCK